MTIDAFQEKLLKLSPGNLMAMNGAESGILGTNGGTNIIQEMQRAAIEFGRSYKTGDDDNVRQARKQVIAKILVAQTLDVISEKSAEVLLDDIAELMTARKANEERK